MEPTHHSFAVFIGHTQLSTLMSTGGHKDSIKSIQVLPLQIDPKCFFANKFDSQRKNIVEFVIQNIFGQAIGWDPVTQHPTRFGMSIINCHLMT
ncbi:MAG: hypothetical protein ACD_62C00589G0003 [uncultured bacterium]|nr:MAG: hypothetical protein ACD_62C00589G0003 [uncultured bacterium]